jgi:hypothetical protein
MSDPISPEEFCVAQIRRLQAEYHKAAEPWLRRLTEIYSHKPLPPMYVPLDQVDPSLIGALLGSESISSSDEAA